MRRAAPGPLRLVLTATALIALGYLLAFAGERGAQAGTWLLAVGLSALMPATMALGVPRSGPRARVVRTALWCTFAVLLAAFGAALTLPATEGPDSALFLGFPPRAAIVIYGAGVLPLVALPLVYAWAFESPAGGAPDGPGAPPRDADRSAVPPA